MEIVESTPEDLQHTGGHGASTCEMTRHPLSEDVLVTAIDRLARVDADVARALERVGYPAPRQREPGFATLLRIMVAQQLSTKSAAAIWARVEQACLPLVSAESFLALDEAAFKTIGFSRQKTAYGRSLAEAVASRALDLDALATLPEEEAIAAIAARRGFGRWSAEIYLLFALGRADIFPADDLGLQVGMQRLKRLETRPKRKAMDALAEPWRPLRGCGAIFLWHFYGAATLDDRKTQPAA
jgi:DNA-3-methyladenine glycosylase II